jgi:hypothetical protein
LGKQASVFLCFTMAPVSSFCLKHTFRASHLPRFAPFSDMAAAAATVGLLLLVLLAGSASALQYRWVRCRP